MSTSNLLSNQKEKQDMQKAGQIASELKNLLIGMVRPGISTQELDRFAEDYIIKKGAKPAFKGFQGYPATLNTNINEVVVHGIPSSRKLQKGDVVTIDLGVIWNGMYSDTAVSVEVATNDKDVFLQAGREALENAIQQCVEGKHIGDISYAMQERVERDGYAVIRKFTGHGIGSTLHMPPEIPCFGRPNKGLQLKAGMALAVEVMYSQGGYQLKILEDGWTAVTKDGSLSAQFEETVLVDRNKPMILTNVHENK